MNKVAKTLPLLISFGCFNVLPAVAEINKAYNLIETDKKTDNTITKYVFNEENYAFEPRYYNLEFSQTKYGNVDSYDSIKYYTFDSSGKIVESDKENAIFEYYVNSSRTLNSPLNADYNSGLTLVDKDFTGLTTSALNFINFDYPKSIEKVSGNFFNNTTTDGNSILQTYNYVENVSGNFINNSNETGSGGAINVGIANKISGTFIGNNAGINGGAITTENSSIDTIEGNFIANHANENGGAIYKDTYLNTLKGDFIGNSADEMGGAIYNTSYGNFELLEGDFIGNSATSGGAIYNAGTIETVNSNFYKNNSQYSGGAVYNTQYIQNITGDFVGNKSGYTGGAIYNNDYIDNITGDFVENSSRNEGGAISNNGNIGNLQGNFIKNTSYNEKYSSSGGAIYNVNNIQSIKGDFIENSASIGGAISNVGYSTIGAIEGDFIGNTASELGGAIYNNYSILDVTSNFIGNKVEGEDFVAGGAVAQNSSLGQGITFVNSSFIENYAKSINDEAKGGAIYTSNDANIIATNGYTSLFEGNYTDSNGIIDNNAVYVAFNQYGGSSKTEGDITYVTQQTRQTEVNLVATKNGSIIFNDKIGGDKKPLTIKYSYIVQNGKQEEISRTEGPERGYVLNVKGDETGKIVFNNTVENAEMSLSGTNLVLGKNDTVLSGNDMTFKSGHFDTVNNSIGNTNFNNFTLTGPTTTSVDVDLYNVKMDRITAQNYKVQNNGFLDVNYLNLLNDAKENKTVILYADKELANNVAYTGKSPVAYSPLWKYDVSYNVHDDDLGYFTFDRGSDTNNYENYNPSALPAVISTNAGGYTTQLQVFEYAFKHSDAFMALPAFERMAIINGDKYAMANPSDTTDVGYFSPLMTQFDTRGIWLKPYSSFENIPLKNGPKVSNISYGTLVGYDSNLRRFRNGFSGVLTGYLGYNGASQRYSGIDTYQNGGLVGLTGTLYKGNFFNATTISAGATVGSSGTMYGHEDYTMLISGIGNKFGYDFEFKDGKFIFQPSLFLAYTFVNTFDYTNAAGLKIKSDPLHAFQIAPGVKFFMNTKNGWQPYLRADMVWNLLDKNKVTAGDVRLPEMSIKPYVQYGVGVQKTFKNDTLTFFGQTLIQNGGRNGVSLNAGIRWAIGKLKKKS